MARHLVARYFFCGYRMGAGGRMPKRPDKSIGVKEVLCIQYATDYRLSKLLTKFIYIQYPMICKQRKKNSCVILANI